MMIWMTMDPISKTTTWNVPLAMKTSTKLSKYSVKTCSPKTKERCMKSTIGSTSKETTSSSLRV